MFLEVRCRVFLIPCILLCCSTLRCCGWSVQPSQNNFRVNKPVDSEARRRLFQSLMQSTSHMMTLALATGIPTQTLARNLPEATGADTANVGTVEALIPIVALRSSLVRLESDLVKSDGSSLQIDETIPKDEKDFKRLFDSYSDPVSYKQRFLDQNAFLVYYTRGFDGPGRANIEEGVNERQTVQFGLRNEAWIAWENFLNEIKFLHDDDNDCASYLSSTLQAVNSYLALVPIEDLKTAKEKLGVPW